ncbi:hypothetical protein LDFHOB_09980 [Candidatus Electronema aureum]
MKESTLCEAATPAPPAALPAPVRQQLGKLLVAAKEVPIPLQKGWESHFQFIERRISRGLLIPQLPQSFLSFARCALTHEDDLDLSSFLGAFFSCGEVFSDGFYAFVGNLYGWGGKRVAVKPKLS